MLRTHRIQHGTHRSNLLPVSSAPGLEAARAPDFVAAALSACASSPKSVALCWVIEVVQEETMPEVEVELNWALADARQC